MARASETKIVGKAVAGLLTASLIVGTAWSQSAPPAATPTPAPFSKECYNGSADVVTASPLPNVAAALQKRQTIRILAIGGTSGRRHGGFTRQIERILKQVMKVNDVVIINRGVSGELATNASQRIKNEVAINDPDLVIWQVGTNDALAFVPLDEFAESVQSTIVWLKEHNVDVVLAGLQYVDRLAQDDNYYRIRELLREIAAKEHVMIIRRYEAMQFIAAAQESSGNGLGPDEFERTEAGYNCLAQYLASAITIGAFGKGMSGRPLRSQGQGPQQKPSQ